MKVLVIEHSRFQRLAIERSLRRAGYSVNSISDGQIALAAARSFNPDLIVLDMMLPGTEGCAVLNALKADEATMRIPVVVLSGMAQKNAHKLMKAGAVEYLEKASLNLMEDGDALIQRIEELLRIPEQSNA